MQCSDGGPGRRSVPEEACKASCAGPETRICMGEWVGNFHHEEALDTALPSPVFPTSPGLFTTKPQAHQAEVDKVGHVLLSTSPRTLLGLTPLCLQCGVGEAVLPGRMQVALAEEPGGPESSYLLLLPFWDDRSGPNQPITTRFCSSRGKSMVIIHYQSLLCTLTFGASIVQNIRTALNGHVFLQLDIFTSIATG